MISANKTNYFEIIPQPIFFEIAKNFPEDYLFKMQRVCKNWQATLRNFVEIACKIQAKNPFLSSFFTGVHSSFKKYFFIKEVPILNMREIISLNLQCQKIREAEQQIRSINNLINKCTNLAKIPGSDIMKVSDEELYALVKSNDALQIQLTAIAKETFDCEDLFESRTTLRAALQSYEALLHLDKLKEEAKLVSFYLQFPGLDLNKIVREFMGLANQCGALRSLGTYKDKEITKEQRTKLLEDLKRF